MRFNSPYFHDDVFFSPSGSKEIDDKCLAYDSEGYPYLKVTGKIPLYAKIQSSRSECDLENVLKACVHQNQLNSISIDSVNEMINDFSTVQSLGDILVASKQLNQSWLELPIEVRENFNSNIHEFALSIGTKDFNDKLHDGFNRFQSSISSRLDVVKPDVVKPDVVKPDVVKPDVVKPDILD